MSDKETDINWNSEILGVHSRIDSVEKTCRIIALSVIIIAVTLLLEKKHEA